MANVNILVKARLATRAGASNGRADGWGGGKGGRGREGRKGEALSA